jgi:hypothetical protein
MVGYCGDNQYDRKGNRRQEDFVTYALKLGYKRDLASEAERRVGRSASLNTKMMTLINLVNEEKRNKSTARGISARK